MIKLFRNFIDEANLSESDLDLFSYSTDSSRITGKAELVVWPKSVEDLQKICHIASRHNLPITPRGAGCNLVGGAVPRNGLVVDMCKMNNVLDINDDYAYVEAGANIQTINKKLFERQFPIIPLNHKIATIGGMISSNAFCSRTSEIGRMVDWVLELEAVDSTGKFYKLKGEAMRHFIGLEGSTGIIAKAKLRLEPIQKRNFSMASFNTIDAMSDYLKERKTNPIQTDFLDEISAEMLGLEPKLHIIEVHPDGVGNVEDDEEAKLLANLHETLDLKLKRRGYGIIEAPLIPDPNVEKMIYWLRKNSVPSYAHLGCNIFVCYFKENLREANVFRQTVKNLNGNLAYGFGFGLKYKDLITEEDKEKIAVLKETYDPKNIMNRGKMI